MARGLAASFVTDRFDRFVTFYRRCVILYDVISFFIRFAKNTHAGDICSVNASTDINPGNQV